MQKKRPIEASDETRAARIAFNVVVAAENVRSVAWRGDWVRTAAAVAAIAADVDKLRQLCAEHGVGEGRR